MSLVNHLLENGSVEDGGGYRDPESLGDKYSYVGAIGIQYRGTALAALELAEPLLTDYRKYLISAGQPGYGEVTEALATVRAAKEGRDI